MPDDRLASLKIEREPEPEGPGLLRFWWVGVLVLLLAGAAWAILARPKAIEVVTAVAREERGGGGSSAGTILNASGYVTARLQATVSSKFTGRVVEVLIEEGMAVEEGQLMARLDASNVEVNLGLARAQASAARAALEETRVRRREAELELRRVEGLAAAGIAGQAELDAAQATFDSLTARLVQQEEEVAVAERQVAVWRQQLADTEIRAPFAGVVVSKNAQPGEMISPAAAGGGFTRTGIGTIVDMESLEIEVDVNESYINRVTPGQPVEATLDAYTDWKIPARVIAIVPTADRQRATVKVRIGFDQLDPRILPDMGVKVAFLESETDPDARAAARVLLPKRVVRSDGGRDIVWLIRDGKAERRAVSVGPESGDDVVIRSGVSAGERVILSADGDLEDGIAVEEVSE